MKSIFQHLKQALFLTIALLLICGLAYPLALTGVSQLMFNSQANGSMVEVDGKIVGSKNIGQDFSDARYFKCRPSQYNYNTYTAEDLIEDEEGNTAYGGVSSGSANYGASNPDLLARVEADMEEFLAANPTIQMDEIPTDLVTASGSGLDPHISVDSAKVQIPAIAAASGLSETRLQEIVDTHTSGKALGVFGEVTVNVLMVNLDIAQELNLV